jgi:hypothetical protein
MYPIENTAQCSIPPLYKKNVGWQTDYSFLLDVPVSIVNQHLISKKSTKKYDKYHAQEKSMIKVYVFE